MSSAFDTKAREERFEGVHAFEEGWALRVFRITASGVRFGDTSQVLDAIAQLLSQVTARESVEYDYGRFGCAVVHTGRRGVCISITHFGGWGTTFEVFSSVWYRYGYGFDGFELLNDSDPALCWFEVVRVMREIESASQLVGDRSLAEIRRDYLAAPV